jgi:hypothetical protein
MAGTVRKGVEEKLVTPSWTTVSTLGKVIPNYGVTHLAMDGTTVNEVYILDAPVEGVRKTIHVSGTTVSSAKTLTIRANATSAGAVSFGPVFADALSYGVSSAANQDGSVELVGINSTRWAIVSARATTVTTV